MKTVIWNKKDDVLHIEVPLGIVNIRVGLEDADGNKVDSVEFLPNDYAGEPKVILDPPVHNHRFIQKMK